MPIAELKTVLGPESASAVWDWRAPDYPVIFEARAAALRRIRAQPALLSSLRDYYRDHPADFIDDWGMTYDPRNVGLGRPALIPFRLFPRQREWIDWVLELWRAGAPGLCEKSRDMGVSWLAVSLACTLCIFHGGMSIGFGSRKAEYVDKLGEMKSLLPKARFFMRYLPEEFRAGFAEWRDSPLMRLFFPETDSAIGGEGGDDVGRGDRRSLYFVDEFAHFERPDLADAALSQTAHCRIDMSSVRGMNNAFARKRWSGRVSVFVFDWRDDPRKDEEWYKKQCAGLEPVVVAQEIDRDYGASVAGVVIPATWARACIDAAKKLGIELTGERGASFDIADEGIDKNAFCGTTGIEIDVLAEWSGKGSDTFETTQRVFDLCDTRAIRTFRYDADGIGAGVRGDARIINEKRAALQAPTITAESWRGSQAVHAPNEIVEGALGIDGNDKGRLNKDYFLNAKAQAWWTLRRRIQKTYRWVVEGMPCHPDEILSISSACPLYLHLVAELSQPTYKTTEVGKIVINKKPNGMPSPNLGDAVMMRFAPGGPLPSIVSQDMLRRMAQLPRRRRY